MGYGSNVYRTINVSQQANTAVTVNIVPAELDDPTWAFSGTPSASGAAGNSYLNYAFIPDEDWDASSVPCYLHISGSQSKVAQITARSLFESSGQVTLTSTIQGGDSYLITVSRSNIVPE